MTSPIDGTVRQLRRLIGGAEQEALADRQLLARYLASKDEAAFAALVKRHASMVLGVCRRVLACPQDAEDACQATFLVLAKKATSIHLRESLRCWLHGVAFRVASNLRRQKLRRKEGRRKWRQRTPALAARLTDHVWTIAEWLNRPAVQRE